MVIKGLANNYANNYATTKPKLLSHYASVIENKATKIAMFISCSSWAADPIGDDVL